jgi:hypothetical protein
LGKRPDPERASSSPLGPIPVQVLIRGSSAFG